MTISEVRARRIGFTATRSPNTAGRMTIAKVVTSLHRQGVIAVVGACIGGDAYIARCARHLGILVHAIVPSDRRQVDPEWRTYCTSFIELPSGHPEPFRERNTVLVDDSDELIAFPEYPEQHPKSRRSGTWMTVRIARRAGKPIQVYVLSDADQP